MNTLLLTLAALFSPSAHAAGDSQFYCHGIHGSEGKTFFAKLLSQDEIREGDKMDFLLVIRDGTKTLFSGHVIGESEDVMLSFKSRRNASPKVEAMIYLDEYDQTWAKIGSKEYRFDCAPNE